MTVNDYLRARALGVLGNVVQGGSPAEQGRLTFISDTQRIAVNKIRTYDIWYKGDSAELNNRYNKENTIGFNYEPIYYENDRNMFWSVASTEKDIKRTHSGMPQDIVNTLVGLVDRPVISVSRPSGNEEDEDEDEEEGQADPVTGQPAPKKVKIEKDTPETTVLREIFGESGFWDVYTGIQMPMTLVEGWGCYKISWDLAVSDHPYITYYRAENVDFMTKCGKVIGIVFKDWYRGKREGDRYLVTELRYLKPRREPETGRITRDLYMETRAWKVSGGDGEQDTVIYQDGLSDVPELAGVEQDLMINDFDQLLAQPCIFYQDPTDDCSPGRSIFQNKIDLFDDLDQELSQQSMCVRKSTPVEYFNSDFLEVDPNTGLPIQPKEYDRKYVLYKGGTTIDGTTNTNQPVQVTQPSVDFSIYGQAVTDTVSQILSGLMSPATMGINVAVQSTAKSQREKEKITISTVKHIRNRLDTILTGVVNAALAAEEYIRTGQITQKKYDVSIKWAEFASMSFEDKAAVLTGMLDNGDISPKLYMQKMYGESLSKKDFDDELRYLTKLHDPDQGGMGTEAMGQGADQGMDQGMGMGDQSQDPNDPNKIAQMIGQGGGDAATVLQGKGNPKGQTGQNAPGARKPPKQKE